MAIAVALALGLGYLSGALPWGLWLGRWVRGVDVRTLGSRNLGATNVYRSLGPGLGILTLLLDMAKGAVPVAVVPGMAASQAFPGGREWCMMAVAVAAVAGHMWTCFAGFRGGKGVATTVGVLLAALGHEVALWDIDTAHLAQLSTDRENRKFLAGIALPKGIKVQPKLEAALDGADFTLFVVPSHGMRACSERVAATGARNLW